MALQMFFNIYHIWKELNILENQLPEDKQSINKLRDIDLFKVKLKSDKKREDELNFRQELIIEQNIKGKNADREKWDVWNMDREADINHQKFVSA